MTEANQVDKLLPIKQAALTQVHRLLQAAAVTFQVGLFLFVGPLALFCLVSLFWTDYFLIPTCYLCWYLWDIPSSTNGGRSGPWVDWVRSWRVWKLNAAYYPVTLVKTGQLPSTRHTLLWRHDCICL